MQGLLLALSDGSLGEPQRYPNRWSGAEGPQLRGLLAHCRRLDVRWGPVWTEHQPNSKDLVLLPIFHNVKWHLLGYKTCRDAHTARIALGAPWGSSS